MSPSKPAKALPRADRRPAARGVQIHAPVPAGLIAGLYLDAAFEKRIDPRSVNGGVFLGLNGTVVKSHGSADSTGVSAAIKLAAAISRTAFH